MHRVGTSRTRSYFWVCDSVELEEQARNVVEGPSRENTPHGLEIAHHCQIGKMEPGECFCNLRTKQPIRLEGSTLLMRNRTARWRR